jgi:hypothetical protein
MFKKFSLLPIFLFVFALCQSQKINTIKLDFLEIEADEFVGFDGFNNCYVVKDNILFKKIDTTILQYQNLSLGKISKVDLLNPLKIIIFYSDFNTVIVLDNQLNEIQKIEFSKFDTPVVISAAGTSGQNKLWFFNTLNQQIGLFDLVTNQFQYIGTTIRDSFTNYQTDFNYFQFIDKKNQWNIYTIFGRYFQNGTIEPNLQVQLLNDRKYLFYNGESLYLKDNSTNSKFEIEIVEKTFKKFYYKEQILSIFTDQGITNYKITIP